MSTTTNASLLTVDDLTVDYVSRHDRSTAVRSASFTVGAGEIVAIVGESGSGKTTLAHSVLGMLPSNARTEGGSIRFGGRELRDVSKKEFQSIRGREIALIPQDPGTALNPVRRVGWQVAETLRIHGLATKRQAPDAAVELLRTAGLPDPELIARRFPHELSGGMRQRVLIAIALAGSPSLIIADEPTSALDVTVQRTVLDHLDLLVRERGTSVVLITHDLAMAAERADRVVVMRSGSVVESGPSAQVLSEPGAAYTRELIANDPGITAGSAVTSREHPVRAVGERPLLRVTDLTKTFRVADGRSTSSVAAVASLNLELYRTETVGIVGESGSGKTTSARLILGLGRADSGSIEFDGDEIGSLGPAALRAFRQRAQLIYQNPYASLNPRFSVAEIVAEPLRAFGRASRDERRDIAAELVERVGLAPQLLSRRPSELSGGQRQRVAIARALSLSPDLVVCDEPVSALDVTVQAQILDLLGELQRERGLSYLFISHDLSVVRNIADRVVVMRRGEAVEQGTVEEIYENPQHPYTRQLIAAVPKARARTTA